MSILNDEYIKKMYIYYQLSSQVEERERQSERLN
jgi:hypothetical protein